MPAGSICPNCKVGHIIPTGRFEQREPEWHEYKCDNCGHIVRELFARDKGKGNESRVHVVVTNPIARNGKTQNLRTARTTVKGKEQDTTIIRTIDAERAPLQLKWIQQGDRFVLVHVHCMKDRQSSAWNRTSGTPVDKLYDVARGKAGVWTIRCKKCGRTWNSDATDRYLM